MRKRTNGDALGSEDVKLRVLAMLKYFASNVHATRIAHYGSRCHSDTCPIDTATKSRETGKTMETHGRRNKLARGVVTDDVAGENSAKWCAAKLLAAPGRVCTLNRIGTLNC